MTDGSDVMPEALTVEVCSACGAMAGQSAHGHGDGRPWEWQRVEYVAVSAVMAALAVCEVPTPTAMEVLRVARAVRDDDDASDITALPPE